MNNDDEKTCQRLVKILDKRFHNFMFVNNNNYNIECQYNIFAPKKYYTGCSEFINFKEQMKKENIDIKVKSSYIDNVLIYNDFYNNKSIVYLVDSNK